MKHRSRIFFTATAIILHLLLLTSCSSVQVSQDFKFSNQPMTLNAFNWSPSFLLEGGVKQDDPLLHDRFISSITSALETKGYFQSDAPQFLVQYSYEITSRLRNDPSPDVVLSVGRYSRYHGVGFTTGSSSIEQIDVGYLNIDFLNQETGEVFWRGRGSRTVRHHYSPQELTNVVNELVKQVLSQYPNR